MLSVLRLTTSDYPFGIFWPLCCLSFDWRLLITLLVSFDHYVVCPSIDVFWLPLWYLLTIVLSLLLRLTTSDYPFGILKIFLPSQSTWIIVFVICIFIFKMTKIISCKINHVLHSNIYIGSMTSNNTVGLDVFISLDRKISGKIKKIISHDWHNDNKQLLRTVIVNSLLLLSQWLD
jgi:hypothetical protein